MADVVENPVVQEEPQLASAYDYSPLQENATYCRVENGEIVEYPVPGICIKNRAHPIEWYTLVEEGKRPENVPAFHMTPYKPVLQRDGSVVLEYTVEPVPLEVLMHQLPSTEEDHFLPGFPKIEKPAPTPELIARIQELITERVQQRLDRFANEHGYDGILSAVSYVSSTNTQWSTDAKTAIEARDLTWAALHELEADIQAGKVALPNTWAKVEAYLPTLSWTATA